ncbi:hypothetical protein [Spirillospora sp. NPDC029432]|uniref:hypothetical protein n=1 Tax=Spirillospora sp. NPDC029432 TaxID=3154599 RepID=UPI0034531582
MDSTDAGKDAPRGQARLLMIGAIAGTLQLGTALGAHLAGVNEPDRPRPPSFGEGPSGAPTGLPTNFPTNLPTGLPSDFPTGLPSDFPTGLPTNLPTQLPTGLPTNFPTGMPQPTLTPGGAP